MGKTYCPKCTAKNPKLHSEMKSFLRGDNRGMICTVCGWIIKKPKGPFVAPPRKPSEKIQMEEEWPVTKAFMIHTLKAIEHIVIKSKATDSDANKIEYIIENMIEALKDGTV